MTSAPTTIEFASIQQEFVGAQLPDHRLHDRMLEIVEDLARDPSQPFPQQVGTPARLEALYRFVNNPRLDSETLLGGHFQQTAQRAAQQGVVLVLHDTTRCEFAHAQAKELGYVETGGAGFYAHCSLVVSANDDRQALGLIGLETRHRPQRSCGQGAQARACRKQKGKEMQRWGRAVNLASERLADCEHVIHVGDRGADSYELLHQLTATQDSYVLRALANRRAWEAAHPHVPWSLLRTLVRRAPVVLEREVTLSRRTMPKKWKGKRPSKAHGPRTMRTATLHVAALSVALARPGKLRHSFPDALQTNVVYVFEPHPPAGAEPVEWLLYTSEPIGTPEEVAFIVDAYRSRWVIEEFFKALKTGCAYQKRQLESKRGLLNALALFAPIAVRLLWFRAQAQRREPVPARVVLTPPELEVLRRIARTPLSRNPTAREALWAVASLGGHLPANGEPGWLVLCRGFHILLVATKFFSSLSGVA